MNEQELKQLALQLGIGVEELKSLIARGQIQTSDLQKRKAAQEAFMGKDMTADRKMKKVSKDLNKRIAYYKDMEHELALAIADTKEIENAELTGQLIRNMHKTTDKWGLYGAAALMLGALPGVVAAGAPEALYLAGRQVLPYLNPNPATMPWQTQVLNPIFTGLAIGQMAGPNGVQKTINHFNNGEYGKAALSAAGDLLNGYVFTNGASLIYNGIKALGSQMEALPALGELNPFVKTTKTVISKSPNRVVNKVTTVDQPRTEQAIRDLWHDYFDNSKIDFDNKNSPKIFRKWLNIEDYIRQSPITITKTTGSYRPTTTTTNTSWGVRWKLPWAPNPYGIPQILPESEIPGVGGLVTRVYNQPYRTNGLNGIRGAWQSTTKGAPVKETVVSPNGKFPISNPVAQEAPVTMPGAFNLPPALGLPPYSNSESVPVVQVGPLQKEYIVDAPTYNSAEVHYPPFEAWWKQNYSPGDTGVWNGNPYVFTISPDVWRRDATNSGYVSPGYQRAGDYGDYQYIIEDNGYAIPEDTTGWVSNPPAAKRIKAKAKKSGTKKTRKK